MRALVLGSKRSRPSEWGEPDEPVVDARLLAILDLSGSMAMSDAGDGNQRRVDVLKEALDGLVESFPNQIAAIGFNCDAFAFRPGAELNPTGSTNLYGALRLAATQALIIKNVVLVSDGQPTDGKPEETLDVIANWKALGVKFSVVYCGPEGGSGEKFLSDLAAVGGGVYTRTEVKAHLLVDALQTALLAAPRRGIIQL